MQTNPDPKIRSTPDKTGTRHYFANRGSLKPPKHWMTQIWIGLCIYFLQCCIKKFSDRAPLVNFARQEQGCRATTPQQPVLQSIPQALHIPNFPPLEGYALIHGGFYCKITSFGRRKSINFVSLRPWRLCSLQNIDLSAVCSAQS